ncbi:MAG TPA: hypothetical protein VH740_17300 [Vicinamibacterales bacterium]|jgi:hypothetical protein
MNLARVAVAAVVTWVVYLGVSFVVHTIILADVYMAHRSVMRPEDQANAILPIGFVFALVGFFAFAYAYAKGYEGGSGLQEGLRFGVIVGILLCCFGKIWEYMVWPVSGTLLISWMVENIVEFALYGSIVGLLYKPTSPALRKA